MTNSKTREYPRSRESGENQDHPRPRYKYSFCTGRGSTTFHTRYLQAAVTAASVHWHIWKVLQQVLKEEKFTSMDRARGSIAVEVFLSYGEDKETIVSVVCRWVWVWCNIQPLSLDSASILQTSTVLYSGVTTTIVFADICTIECEFLTQVGLKPLSRRRDETNIDNLPL